MNEHGVHITVTKYQTVQSLHIAFVEIIIYQESPLESCAY